MTRRRLSRSRKRGFTLIELLVVLAITSILLGLIFGPMVQSFNLTNRARVQVLAQDSARAAIELIQRDVANGVFVFHQIPDPTKTGPRDLVPGEFPFANSVRLWVRDSDGAIQPMLLPYGMIDFVPPARQNDVNLITDPTQIDPTTDLAISRGDMALPVAPGRVVIRYWAGLRNNASEDDALTGLPGRAIVPYGNFYESQSEPDPTRRLQNHNDHNPVLLYRAVFSPYLPNLLNGVTAQVDTRLFHVVTGTNSPRLYDPNFWHDNTEATAVTLPDGTVSNQVQGWKDDNRDGKVNICENWRALARSVVPVDRADEVVPERTPKKATIYDAVTKLPRLIPVVRFQPTYVGNNAGSPSAFADTGNEVVNLAPGTYTHTNGAWTLPYRLYVFRSPLSDTLLKYYFETGNGDIRYQEYDTGTASLVTDTSVGFALDGKRELAASARPEMMFTVDTKRGLVNFSFPDWTILHDSAGVHMPSTFDPVAVNVQFDAAAADAVAAKIDGASIFRYINLGVMDPAFNPELLMGFRPPLEKQMDGKTYIPNVRIVPGSERVWAPDQRPGPNYGTLIPYTRVAGNTDPKDIGPNEYKINPFDLPNLQPPDPTDPPSIQAMHEASLKAGTIIFNSRSDRDGYPVANALPTKKYDPATGLLTLDADKIVVTYQIQNNLASDVVKADYLTRELMTVALGVRLFDFNSGQPQQVSLTQKVKVRNLTR